MNRNMVTKATIKKCVIGLNMRSIMLLQLLFLLLPISILGQGNYDVGTYYSQSVIHEGIKVEFSLIHVDPSKDPNVFTQDDDVLFRFEITDTLSNKPVTGAAPAAWMEPMVEAEDQVAECGQKISSFLTGTLFKRAELDLNVFYVLVMNDDPSITVVDPLFSFGGSQLLAYVDLMGVPEDWAVSKDQLTLYVTIPKSGMVAVVNTSDWSVEEYVPINANVHEVVLQPDGAYVWTDFESGKIEGYSGVAAISTESNSVMASILTGGGEHQIVVTDDNKYVFVSNRDDATVSVIDVNSLQKIKDIPINGEIVSMEWSSMAEVVYVLDTDGGLITGIDANSLEIINQVQGKPGISALKFDPTGRFGFILGKEEGIVQILDVASNRIVQNGTTEALPTDVVFSDELAYVMHEESEIVLMFPIDVIGKEGQRLQAADFPGGQYPPGKVKNPSRGELMVQAPGANAMLVANSLDKTIYYYMEGMAAPMGSFSNYSKVPRAVEVIDRSIEERRPGVYETVAKIRGFGKYDVPFFVDVPRLIHCFSVGVMPNEDKVQEHLKNELGTLSIQHFDQPLEIQAGDSFNVLFALTDPTKNEQVSGLDDVKVRCISSSNMFYEGEAKETDTPGIYNSTIKFDQSGVYFIYVGCKSKNLDFTNPQYLILKVLEKKT